MSRSIKTLWAQLALQRSLEFFYPPACLQCRESLNSELAGSGAGFCQLCEQALLGERGAVCERCGAGIGPLLNPQIKCGYCHTEKFAFDRVFRLGIYDGPLAQACRRIKQPREAPLTAALAELTWRESAERLQMERIDLVVPVPHFWLQRWLGRQDAVDHLAEAWGARLRAPVERSILKKTRWTPRQSSLSPSERRKNLRRAFAVRKGMRLNDRTILIADDVMTTGTTLHEVARVLKQAGAGCIVGVVIARGLGLHAQPTLA